MNSLLVAILSFVGFIIAYKLYAEFISKRLFGLDSKAVTPAHELRDDVDFVPTRREILFGHHYTSIAGTGPIVGPAIAVIWGWLPALLWIVFGAIFIGGIHDFGALVISARHKGNSIGELTGKIINSRVRTLLLLVIFFSILIVLAIFCLVIAIIFDLYPQSIFPIFLEIPLAIAIGYRFYEKGRLRATTNILLWTIIALIIMYISIYVGILIPFKMPSIGGLSPLSVWVLILLVYVYIASTLPVWKLLQPRDYINSHELFVVLTLLFGGLVIAHPTIVAPTVNAHPVGAPPIIPFIFITIACGAISGFHSLVSSGTTSKQLDNEVHAKSIAYGGMLLEGVLAVLVLVACTAGLGNVAAWNARYASWATASGLVAKVSAFVDGGKGFLVALGIPDKFALGILGVMVASFAGTTIDTATRIQRYVITELAIDYNIKILTTRHGATLCAVGTAAALALSRGGGKGGLILWPLFGTTNQLLAGLALMVVTTYLIKRRKPGIYTFLPMIFMLSITSWALISSVRNFYVKGDWLLTILGGIVLLLAIWMILETYKQYTEIKRSKD